MLRVMLLRACVALSLGLLTLFFYRQIVRNLPQGPADWPSQSLDRIYVCVVY